VCHAASFTFPWKNQQSWSPTFDAIIAIGTVVLTHQLEPLAESVSVQQLVRAALRRY